MAISVTQIDDFVRRLAQMVLSPNCANPYDRLLPANALRRHNLRLYLRDMRQRQPRFFLVGEAPGYRGCRLTGVPFTSPRIIDQGVPAFQLFGATAGYRCEGGGTAVVRESTATMVWQTLSRQDQCPLLWNAFPFHPFKADDPFSNRTPLQGELALGEIHLRQLLQLFPGLTIISVGRKADVALTRWQITHRTVRHPSYGGKEQFATGLLSHFGHR